jgi:sugar-specific transcriptional regulator TrmB
LSLDLTGLAERLRGFGLSDYEARAYVALIRAGSLPVSDLTYHAAIPRPKAYHVVRNLERKGLVKVLSTKPLICRAVPPEQCLARLLEAEEERLERMRRVLTQLESMRAKAGVEGPIEEGRHLVLGSEAISGRLQDLAAKTVKSALLVVDGWGYQLFAEHREALAALGAKGCEVRVVVAVSYGELGGLEEPPSGLDVRVVRRRLGVNVYLFDEDVVLLVNGRVGKGILLSSREMNQVLKGSLFTQLWAQAIPLRDVISYGQIAGGEDLLDLLDVAKVESLFSQAVFEALEDPGMVAAIGARFVELLESEMHLGLFREPLEVQIPLLNTLLKRWLGDGAQVRYDPTTGILSVIAPGAERGLPPSPWLYALLGSLSRRGLGYRVLQNLWDEYGGGRVLQLKLELGLRELKEG